MKYFPDNSNYSLKEFLSSYSATLSNVLDEIDEDKLKAWIKAEQSSQDELDRLTSMQDKLWDNIDNKNKRLIARKMNFG